MRNGAAAGPPRPQWTRFLPSPRKYVTTQDVRSLAPCNFSLTAASAAFNPEQSTLHYIGRHLSSSLFVPPPFFSAGRCLSIQVFERVLVWCPFLWFLFPPPRNVSRNALSFFRVRPSLVVVSFRPFYWAPSCSLLLHIRPRTSKRLVDDLSTASLRWALLISFL